VSDAIISPQWRRLVAGDLRGTIMIVGASDTGKSTLARYLFQALCRRDLVVAYLDLDVGQSSLGLPTTLNVALAGRADCDRFPPGGPHIGYFVGATTPRGHMLPAVVGAYRLQQEALAHGAGAIVVDTTGLVDRAQGGKALKEWQIELLAPDVVVGLQRDRELEPILWPLRRDGRTQSVELPVSPYVEGRGRQARIARRRERLAAYFGDARRHSLSLKERAVYGVENLAPGALLAFQDARGFALGLGAVQDLDRAAGTVVVRSPLKGLEGVSSLRLGTARWDLAQQAEG
jgi:polynucleotide 5'-hydroxyl-kinase GRC3/NOL9